MRKLYHEPTEVEMETIFQQIENSRCIHKPVLHLADPYFIPYGRLCVPAELEIKVMFTLFECPFRMPFDEQREGGDFFV